MKPSTLCQILPLRLKVFSISILLFLLCGCNLPNNDVVLKLKIENASLKSQNDSLVGVISTLKASPEDILSDVNSLIALNERDSALALLNMLKSRLPDQKATVTLNKITKKIKSKQTFQNAKASKRNTSAKKETIPKVETFAAVDNSLENKSEPNKWKNKTTEPAYTPAHKKAYQVRVGALCWDGSKSSATGRGACSHHGGVREWLYE